LLSVGRAAPGSAHNFLGFCQVPANRTSAQKMAAPARDSHNLCNTESC
jgi:hypothetical protein